MTTALRIPNVGESIQEVQIGHWLKHEGDHVDEDENVVELETDKASMELPSPAAGILKIVKQEGEAAAIGETIAYVDEVMSDGAEQRPSEKPIADEKQRPPQSIPQKSEQKAATADRETVAKKETPIPQPTQPPDGHHHQAKTQSPAYPTPSARRALREHDLTAEEVEAAGKQLRREDVLRHVERQKKRSRRWSKNRISCGAATRSDRTNSVQVPRQRQKQRYSGSRRRPAGRSRSDDDDPPAYRGTTRPGAEPGRAPYHLQ